MEWGVKENKIAVISLHKVGVAVLSFSKHFMKLVSATCPYTLLSTHIPSLSLPRVVRTIKAVKVVKNRIHRNPFRKKYCEK